MPVDLARWRKAAEAGWDETLSAEDLLALLDELEAARAERDEKMRMLEVIAEKLGTDVLSIPDAVRLLVGAVDALTGKLEAARAVVERVPAVLRLDPGCDDHATGLDWCDRCHEAGAAHAELQHAYDAAKAGEAVE